jgi:hypothetical protein
MKIHRTCLGFAAAALVALGALTRPASASLITYTDPMTNFTYNSDTVSSAFNSALGVGYTHISFQGATDTDGSSYSSAVTFSTTASSYGGVTSGLVNASSEIGPYPSWYGQFNIDFTGAVSTVGFGLVDTPATISVYNTAGALLGTYSNDLNTTFSLWGVQATSGEQIGSVTLDGSFYAIQDIEFSANQTSSAPDTGATVNLLGGALIGLAALRRRFLK